MWIGSAEFPAFTLGEIASICAIQFKGRRPSKHTVKAVLADGPRPSYTTRQFPRAQEMTDPKERHLAVIHFHAASAGVFRPWLASLHVSRPTIYAILKRLSWRKGSVASASTSHANTNKLGVDLPTRNLIREVRKRRTRFWANIACSRRSSSSE